MISIKELENFNPVFEIVSCVIEVNNEFLLLKRLPQKSEGNKWGLPAGKVDKGEDIKTAVKREVLEETGMDLNMNDVEYFEKIYVRYPDKDFLFHMFYLKLDSKPEVKIEPNEHSEYLWLKVEDALKNELVQDLAECLKYFYKID